MVDSLMTFGVVLLAAVQGPGERTQKKGPEKKARDVPADSKPILDLRDVPLRRPSGPRFYDRPKVAPPRIQPKNEVRVPQKPVAKPARDREAEQRQTLVLRVRHAAVSELAETVQRWAESVGKMQPPVTVVASVDGNVLLVTGTQTQLTAVRGLVHELDQPVPQIRVRIAIVELTLNADSKAAADKPIPLSDDIDRVLSQLKQRGDVRVVARPELVAQDGSPANIQLGARVPRIVGSMTSSRGTSKQVEMENVGALLNVTSRVADSQTVTLELNLEYSYLGPDDEGTEIGKTDSGVPIRTPRVQTINLKTTVSATSGKTVLLGGIFRKSDHLWRKTVVLLQPDIM